MNTFQFEMIDRYHDEISVNSEDASVYVTFMESDTRGFVDMSLNPKMARKLAKAIKNAAKVAENGS